MDTLSLGKAVSLNFIDVNHECACSLSMSFFLVFLPGILTTTALLGVISIKALRSPGTFVPSPNVQKVHLYSKAGIKSG